MPYSASLIDYQPSPRYGDGVGVWTQARIEQGAVRSGPFEPIETQLLPAYADPAVPPLLDFTTRLLTTYPGWVRVVFLDADGNQEPTEPRFVGSAIRPDVKEIANLMPDRTTLEGGEQAGTFTTATDPTAADVDGVVDMVLDTIEPLVPDEAEGKVLRSARALVALHTAVLIETGHFGEQTEVSDARVTVWERLIERHTTVLASTAEGIEPGDLDAFSIRLRTPLATESELLAAEGELGPP